MNLPLTIFYGFWLRALQPPGHAKNHITLLSSCDPPEEDYLCQHNSAQGNTGIVRINPKDSSDTSKWSEIRWIKFGFTRNFNPVLWLANDSQSGRLQESFERAEHSGPQSHEHKEAMKEDLIDVNEGWQDKKLHYEWPEGRAIVEGSRETGIRDFVIAKLGLKISVQLQPFCSPTMEISGNTDGSGLPLRPMMVWVVDITETTQTRGEIRPLSADRITCVDDFICVSFELISCFSCFLYCRSKMTWAEYWDLQRDENQAKKEGEEEAKRRKQSYERDAHSRVPLLITYEGKP
jgi:hypothetical protein